MVIIQQRLSKKTSEVIKKCFEELILHKVDLTGVILKPNMILAGNKSKDKISNEEVSKNIGMS
jgi:fructose-bisphosphate aldolase class I